MGKFFGTDGIRGKAEKFNAEFLYAVVLGLAKYNDSKNRESFKVLVGGDTRESTEWILRDTENALEACGAEHGNVGVLPTPAINKVFFEMGFDYAIDITASHNPYTDNGIKIFERSEAGGVKLCEEGRDFIERELEKSHDFASVAVELSENLHDEAVEIYLESLRRYLEDFNLAGLKIGLDCANGATSEIAARALESYGAEVHKINADANYGTKINQACGSTHIEGLQKFVKEDHLDFGAAFDGDGDRCLFVDENGEIVDGDQSLAIFAENLGLESLAVTVMANQGLMDWAEKSGKKVVITDVGDSNVAAAMRNENIDLGGEQSGHIILPGEAMGDGILTALIMGKIMAETKARLSSLAGTIVLFPQVLENIPATDEEKAKLKEGESIKKLLIEYAKKAEKMGGRILVRPSGTESLIRITAWGKDMAETESFIKELAEKLKMELTND